MITEREKEVNVINDYQKGSKWKRPYSAGLRSLCPIELAPSCLPLAFILFYFQAKKHKINQQLQQYNQNSKGKEEEGEDTDYILNFTGAFEDEVAGSFICKNRTNSETESPRESVQINFTTQYRKAAGGMVFVLEGSSIQRLRFNF